MRKFRLFLCAGLLPLLFSCEKVIGEDSSDNAASPVALDRVAAMYGMLGTLSAEYFHLPDFLCHFAATNKNSQVSQVRNTTFEPLWRG